MRMRSNGYPFVAALLLAGCGQADRAADNGNAAAVAAPRTADLIDGAGKTVGTVSLSEDPTGTTVVVDVRSMGIGKHGLHLHETGDCTLPDFKSAGGHLNPSAKQHGRDNPQGSHLGDLANISVRDDGTAHSDFLLAGTTMAELFDGDGLSVVVHADPDDYKTDPSGNSGDRVACAAFR